MQSATKDEGNREAHLRRHCFRMAYSYLIEKTSNVYGSKRGMMFFCTETIFSTPFRYPNGKNKLTNK